MTKVIGVRFRTAGKVYYFSPGEHEIKRDMHVIVTTSRGTEYGTVVMPPKEVEDDEVVAPLKEIIRVATEDDDLRAQTNREKEKDAFKTCAQKIREHELEMKLIDAEYTFDNSKALFYFTADGRVDFRELVKDLASVFKTRIELRQIGVRDETKLIGGIGICGRALCCHSYLSDFMPVSIKMAKEQSLSLNPTKISGVCGRLMCCLKNEEEVYEEVNKRMPGIGDIVETPDHLEGEVAGTNVLRETVRVLIDVGDEKEVETYRLDEVKFLRKKPRKGAQQQKRKEELEEEAAAKALEEKEQHKDLPRGEKKQHHTNDRNRNRNKEQSGNRDFAGNKEASGNKEQNRENNRENNGKNRPFHRRNRNKNKNNSNNNTKNKT
ncbi:MAG: stage 0 sporulation family protein [Lachnospiraceae bacterium]|nr:stage 0 sporulation family protein [Lachnospiraceae bacterium]